MRFEDLSTKANIGYHKQLNPAAWDGDSLHRQVRLRLLTIAKIFVKYLEIPNFKVEDVVLTGSMSNYNWTKFSDFDLHIVTDYAALECDDIAEAFYKAKKRIWNDQHDITINGHEVEMYVEDSATPPVSQGIFSILNNQWVSKPTFNPLQANPLVSLSVIPKVFSKVFHSSSVGICQPSGAIFFVLEAAFQLYNKP